ncbi:hypothetical protein D3C81_1104550 [compost metagenome]
MYSHEFPDRAFCRVGRRPSAGRPCADSVWPAGGGGAVRCVVGGAVRRAQRGGYQDFPERHSWRHGHRCRRRGLAACRVQRGFGVGDGLRTLARHDLLPAPLHPVCRRPVRRARPDPTLRPQPAQPDAAARAARFRLGRLAAHADERRAAFSATRHQGLWPGLLCPDRHLRAEPRHTAGGPLDRVRRLAVGVLADHFAVAAGDVMRRLGPAPGPAAPRTLQATRLAWCAAWPARHQLHRAWPVAG